MLIDMKLYFTSIVGIVVSICMLALVAEARIVLPPGAGTASQSLYAPTMFFRSASWKLFLSWTFPVFLFIHSSLISASTRVELFQLEELVAEVFF